MKLSNDTYLPLLGAPYSLLMSALTLTCFMQYGPRLALARFAVLGLLWGALASFYLYLGSARAILFLRLKEADCE